MAKSSSTNRPPFRLDLTGKQFGRWLVLGFAGSEPGSTVWRCRCSCGTTRDVRTGNLIQGLTKSCGCFKVEKARGLPSKFRSEHRIWEGMKRRCRSKNFPQYKDYGGRGIRVCERWAKHRVGFANFMADMGPKPTPKHQIDRRDNDGNYCPENCSWVLPKVNCRNKRNNSLVTVNGETKCIEEWSEHLGWSEAIIRNRLTLGWTHEQAVTTPITEDEHRPRDDNGKFKRIH